MPKLYSTFPNGLSGLSLLLLRVALGVTLIIQGSAYFMELQGLHAASLGIAVVMLAGGIALVIGFITPLASAAAFFTSAGIALSWLPSPGSNLFRGSLLSIDAIAIALSAIFLGPGAFSIDARLFGRRKVIIPRVSHSPEV